ncbi:MAG TPA: SDR family oxidoreductase [Burkholderiales bacterium]|nr:SDR family oxidoreductase [Burkholderiales bacterium]
MDVSLRDKSIVVTGGGSGLGAALCSVLAAEGARVSAADVRFDAARAVADAIRASGQACEAFAMDVGDETSVANALEEVAARRGGIDVVINNAGTDVTVPIEALKTSDWQRIVATNLTGPFLVSKLALRYMESRGDGHIVNIASTAGKRAWPNASAYHATKWGLLGLSYALHAELRPKGIKVTAVVAGGMRTPFLLDRFPDIDPETLQDPHDVAQAVKAVLLLPPASVIPEIMVLPMRESSWP